MADNTELNPGTGGDIIATEEIAGAKLQRIKLALGAVDADDGDVSAANPVPVTGAFFQATQPVSGPLTNAELRATAVPVDASGTTIFSEITDGANIADIISLATPVTGSSVGMVVTGQVAVTQSNQSNLGATAYQGGTWYVQSINSTSTVNSPNASNFLATVASITSPVTVAQSNASNFLATVAGTVTAIQSNASNFLSTISGTVTAIQSNASNLAATVSGTVTANCNVSQISGTTVVASVAGIQDMMPRKRTGATGLSPSYISGRINSSTTTTIVAATCYLSSLHMTCVNTGAAWALKVQDGQATAKVLIPNFVLNVNFSPGGGLAFANPVMLSYAEPILCTSGINVVTVGGAAGNIDYFATYWQ